MRKKEAVNNVLKPKDDKVEPGHDSQKSLLKSQQSSANINNLQKNSKSISSTNDTIAKVIGTEQGPLSRAATDELEKQFYRPISRILEPQVPALEQIVPCNNISHRKRSETN